MTLKEAMETGRRVKRKDWCGFHDYEGRHTIAIEAAIADDWEVEKVKKEGWVNVYPPPSDLHDQSVFQNDITGVFHTKHEAMTMAHKKPLATIKIEWEE